MTTPLAVLARLRGTYWFLPSVVTIASLVLGVVLTQIDRLYPDVALALAFTGGADGARGILVAVAGSMITVVSVTFSVTIVALTVSSQHFGPRLLNSFMRDKAAQLVLGTFIGTFAYCLVVLRTVQGEGDGYARFVPHLAVTMALVLTLISVGTLIYYVHHVSSSLQVSEIAAGVTRDFEAAIDRMYPEKSGSAPAEPQLMPPSPPPGAVRIPARVSGYLQEVDGERLLRVTEDEDVTVWMRAAPGEFVTEGGTLAAVHPAPADRDAFSARLHAVLVIGNDRTARQDVGFAVQQLVEVALHALSPGMNEPFTAITCIDRLGQGLSKLAGRSLPDARRLDGQGRLRIVAPPQTFEQTLRDAIGPIRRHAKGDAYICERLLQVLATVSEVAVRAGDRAAIRTEATSVYEAGLAQLIPAEQPHYEAAYRRVLDVLGSGQA